MNISINCIFVIESLRVNERKTGTNIYNDIIKRRTEQKKMLSDLIDIGNKADFSQFLKDVQDSIENNDLKPYFHFEIHGSRQGLQLQSGELISWIELSEQLRPINIACRNNLWISLATCYGAYIFGAIKPAAAAPFFGYIGAWNILYANDIEAGFGEFFNTLLTEWSLNKALDDLNAANHLPEQYRMYHTAAVFLRVYENYEKENFSPEGFKVRVDVLMDELKKGGMPDDPQIVASTLKKVTAMLVDTKQTYKESYRKKFLMIDLYPEQEYRFDQLLEKLRNDI